MKNIFKKTLVVVMALVICFAFVSCKNKKGDDSTSNGKVKIIVPDNITSKVGLSAWEKERQDEFKKAHPEIEVDYRNNPTSDPSKNIQAVITNLNNEAAAYTLLVTNNNTYARSIYQSRLTEDFTKYLTPEQLASYDQTALSGYYQGDELVGLPTRQDFPMLGFNRKHLQSAEVQKRFDIDPNADDAMDKMEAIIDNIKTWDDFLNVATKLSGTYTVSGNQVSNISGYGGYLVDYYIGFGVWNVSNGYTTVTQHDSGKMDVDFTNQQSVETIQFLQKMVKEKALTHNVNLGYTDFFNQIFQNKIASFIYYPSWATSWFEPNGLYASDIKVINIPYGPSIEKKMKEHESDPSVEVPATNVSFSIGYVLNKRATEEQKKAAITYIMFMQGKEALVDKIEFAKEENIPMFTIPPYQYDDEFLDETLLANVPKDWKTTLKNSLDNYFVFDQNTDSFINYLMGLIPGIVENKNDEYGTDEKLKNRLSEINKLIYAEFLNGYNSNFD